MAIGICVWCGCCFRYTRYGLGTPFRPARVALRRRCYLRRHLHCAGSVLSSTVTRRWLCTALGLRARQCRPLCRPPLRHHCYCGSNCAAPELCRQSPLLRRCLHCAWAACSAQTSPPENRPQSKRRFHMLIHGKFVFASRPAESKTSRAISFSSHVRRPDAERPHGFCSREVKRQSPTLIEMPARNTQAQS